MARDPSCFSAYCYNTLQMPLTYIHSKVLITTLRLQEKSHRQWQWHLRFPTILHPSSPIWSMSTSPQCVLPVAQLSLQQHSCVYNSFMTIEEYKEKYHEKMVILWSRCGNSWSTALPSLVWGYCRLSSLLWAFLWTQTLNCCRGILNRMLNRQVSAAGRYGRANPPEFFLWPQQTLLTLATMVVEAPSFAAATHWFAPFPPKPFLNSVPCRVSPGLGRRWVKLKQNQVFIILDT